MKRLITLISTLMAFAAVSAAHAQQTETAQLPSIAPSPVQVSLLKPYKLALDEAREFQGQYSLQNGKTLTVSRRGQRLFADIAGNADVELVAISQGAFLSKDGKTQVIFQQAANGNVLGVQLQTRAA